MIKAVICDDEKAAMNIIRHYIEREHMPIEIAGTASNGVQALQVIKEVHPDLVFMDINMPLMNGFEVIAKLDSTRVIIITAYDSFEYARKALQLGVCDILAKPIDFEQLGEAIRRAVGWQFTGNEIVDRTLGWLYANYEKQPKLKELAEMVHCSESHLARSFKKETGLSIIAYVHKLRIEKSLLLMHEEDLSIRQIAEMTGYHNLNHFYQYFVQITGMTPAAYRKS